MICFRLQLVERALKCGVVVTLGLITKRRKMLADTTISSQLHDIKIKNCCFTKARNSLYSGTRKLVMLRELKGFFCQLVSVAFIFGIRCTFSVWPWEIVLKPRHIRRCFLVQGCFVSFIRSITYAYSYGGKIYAVEGFIKNNVKKRAKANGSDIDTAVVDLFLYRQYTSKYV